MYRAYSREMWIFSASLYSAILSQKLKNDPTLFWKKVEMKIHQGCFPSPHLILPEPGPHFKFPDDIHPAPETCSSSQDGLLKATLHLPLRDSPLEDG